MEDAKALLSSFAGIRVQKLKGIHKQRDSKNPTVPLLRVRKSTLTFAKTSYISIFIANALIQVAKHQNYPFLDHHHTSIRPNG